MPVLSCLQKGSCDQSKLRSAHCRLMGECNAVKIRQPRLKSSTWEATKRAYSKIITQEERDSGYIPATFQAIALYLGNNYA